MLKKRFTIRDLLTVIGIISPVFALFANLTDPTIKQQEIQTVNDAIREFYGEKTDFTKTRPDFYFFIGRSVHNFPDLPQVERARSPRHIFCQAREKLWIGWQPQKWPPAFRPLSRC
jgi:hypothetical protein